MANPQNYSVKYFMSMYVWMNDFTVCIWDSPLFEVYIILLDLVCMTTEKGMRGKILGFMSVWFMVYTVGNPTILLQENQQKSKCFV